jgi:hypothetical protein
MTKDEVFQQALDVMNSAFKADPGAIQLLLCNCVQANKALVEHPDILVGQYPVDSIGMLGVINGIIGNITGKRIASMWSEPNEDGRCTMIGFCEWQGDP